MRNPTILRTALCGVLFSMSTMGTTLAQNSSPASAKFEQSFLESFPMHHAQAIEMAQVCVQKAAHAELKDLCQQMMTMQTQEKQTMESWLGSWYAGKGTAPASEKAKMKAQHETMMAKLNAAQGHAFDHAFIMSMDQHHQMGIASTGSCITQAGHTELKVLCTKMKNEQQDDMEKMNKLMKQWM